MHILCNLKPYKERAGLLLIFSDSACEFGLKDEKSLQKHSLQLNALLSTY